MRKSKRLLAFVMSIIMLMGVLFSVNISAMAEPALTQGSCGDNVTYTFDADSGTLKISGTGPMYNWGSYSDSIFAGRDEIKEVVIEAGVTTVGQYAFEDCTYLSKITLPEGLTEINRRAFNTYDANGSSINYIKIPSSISSVGAYAFDGTNIFRVEFNGTSLEYEELANSMDAGNSQLYSAAVIQTNDRINGVWQGNEDGSKSYLIDGTPVTGTIFENGNVYLFDEAGKMQVGKTVYNKYNPVDGTTYDYNWVFDNNGALVHNDWYYDGNGWILARENGEIYIDQFHYVEAYRYSDGKLYHFDVDGYMTVGWYALERATGPDQAVTEWLYFYPSGIAAKNEWLTDSQGWVYINYDCVMQRDSIVPDTWGYRYVDSEGRIVGPGWREIPNDMYSYRSYDAKAPMPSHRYDTTWILVNENCYLETDKWVTDSNGWLYLDDEGMMVTDGIVEDSYGPLYVGLDGHPEAYKFLDYAYGHLTVKGISRPGRDEIPCFYAGENGYLTKGWQYVYHEKDDVSEWHYFSDNYMLKAECWATDSQGLLYLDEMGCISRNTLVDSGRRYDDTVYYVNEDGRIDSGWHYIEAPWGRENIWVYADSNGKALEKGWIQDSTGWCYINEYKMVASDWVNVNGLSYYVDGNGHMVTGEQNINGRDLVFADNGVLIG